MIPWNLHLLGHVQRQRKFQGIDFEEGSPNLIVTTNGKKNNLHFI